MDNLVHPGFMIKKRIVEPHLQKNGIVLKDFCKNHDIEYTTLVRVLKGDRAIGATLAIQLSAALGFSEMFFANLQLRYDIEKAKRLPGKPLERGDFEVIVGKEKLKVDSEE